MPVRPGNAAQLAAKERADALQAHARALQLAQAHLAQNPPGPAKGLTPQQIAAPQPAPAAPTFQPDSIYNDSVALAHRNYLASIGAADDAERGIKNDYGFDDTTNPFNRVAMAKQKFLQQGNGITNSLATRGLLYSTSNETQHHANDLGQDQELSALRTAYDALLKGVGSARGQADSTETEAKLRLLAEARQRQGLG